MRGAHACATDGGERARRRARAPVRVLVAVVVAEQVDVLLCVLGHLQRLIDRVEEILLEVGHEVDELLEARLHARRRHAPHQIQRRQQARVRHRGRTLAGGRGGPRAAARVLRVGGQPGVCAAPVFCVNEVREVRCPS